MTGMVKNPSPYIGQAKTASPCRDTLSERVCMYVCMYVHIIEAQVQSIGISLSRLRNATTTTQPIPPAH